MRSLGTAHTGEILKKGEENENIIIK